MEKKILQFLRAAEKPARYIGEEFNTPNFAESQNRENYCMCYPDLYEVGMDNLPYKIAYHMINDRKGFSAERCFAPSLKDGELLKKIQLPLFSLETKTPLAKFDSISFYFKYETQYTTFLYMLDLAGIPLRKSKRTENDPIVFGMGNAMANPEVLADFLDFAIIGDLENALVEVMDALRLCKLNNMSKVDTLYHLSKIVGVYIFSDKIFEFENGKIAKIKGDKVKRAIVSNLDKAYFPMNMQVPYLGCGIASIEIMRGCSRGCRFCQAGFVNRPVRERRVATLSLQTRALIQSTGYNKLGLAALNAADYSQLSLLKQNLGALCKEKNVNIFLPSMRFDAENVSSEKILNFTIEGGSQRLRNLLNKNVTSDEIETIFKEAYGGGCSEVNMYFMIGLPTETAKDLLGIEELVHEARQLYKKYKIVDDELKLKVIVSTFVPKAFTPLQWSAFMNSEDLLKREKILQLLLDENKVEYKFYDPFASTIEAIYSRGDRRLGAFLEVAYRAGAVFDGDAELFNKKAYKQAFEITKINTKDYLAKKEYTDLLPWDLVDFGVNKEYLQQENEKALEFGTTRDCRQGCNGCGLKALGVCKNGNN